MRPPRVQEYVVAYAGDGGLSNKGLCFMRVASSKIELEFRNVDFLRREENRRTRRKTLEARERINNKLNSHMTPSPGIEPGATVVRGERSHRYATHALP